MRPLNESEHITMLRDSLSRFIEKEISRESARAWDQADDLPLEVLDRLAELGVTGLTIPEEYGGSGPDYEATVVVIEELAARSLGVTSGFIMCACYAGMNLVEVGSDEQRQAMLPDVVEGKLRFAYGITEPDVGADIASVRTTASRDGDRIVVNGSKRFCSGATAADHIYTLTRSGPAEDRYRNLTVLLIPPDAPGVTLEPQDTLGLRGLPACDVTFQEVELTPGAILGGEAGWNQGWQQLVGPGLDVERLEVAAMALGIARAAVEDAWNYAQERKQFGKAICTIQSVRHMLADAQTKLAACRLMTYHAARLLNEGRNASVDTAMAKLFVCDTAVEIVLSCQRILGAYGYVTEFDMERYVRDILAMPILGGSSAIQRNNICNRLGLPRK